MRILHVYSGNLYGGIEVILYALAQARDAATGQVARSSRVRNMRLPCVSRDGCRASCSGLAPNCTSSAKCARAGLRRFGAHEHG